MTKKIFYYAHRDTGELVSVTNPINPAKDAMFVPLEQEWLENYFATADVDFNQLPPEELAHAIAMDLANKVNPPPTIPANLTKIDLRPGDTLRLDGSSVARDQGFRIGGGVFIDINKDDIEQIKSPTSEFVGIDDILTTVTPFDRGAAVGDQATALGYALGVKTQSPVEIEKKTKGIDWKKIAKCGGIGILIVIGIVLLKILFSVTAFITIPLGILAGYLVATRVYK